MLAIGEQARYIACNDTSVIVITFTEWTRGTVLNTYSELKQSELQRNRRRNSFAAKEFLRLLRCIGYSDKFSKIKDLRYNRYELY